MGVRECSCTAAHHAPRGLATSRSQPRLAAASSRGSAKRSSQHDRTLPNSGIPCGNPTDAAGRCTHLSEKHASPTPGHAHPAEKHARPAGKHAPPRATPCTGTRKTMHYPRQNNALPSATSCTGKRKTMHDQGRTMNGPLQYHAWVRGRPCMTTEKPCIPLYNTMHG